MKKLAITSISCQAEEMLTAKGIKRIAETITGEAPAIVAEAGAVQLVLDTSVGEIIEIAFDAHVNITASSEKNLFFGGMFLLLMMETEQDLEGKYTLTIPAQESTLMIDIGRKYYSMTGLKKLIDAMALFQFRYLQLHFSENEGFRIESASHPEIMSEHYLTKNEVQELIRYARLRFIEIIPDFDSPGHLEHILKNHPAWCLDMLEEGKLTKAPRALDILNSEAVHYIHSIYEEYAELFQESRYFHIGADEFVPFDELEKYPALSTYAKKKYGQKASGIEAYVEYVNHTIDFVRNLGFVPVVWNDGFYRLNQNEKISLSKDCMISYWTKWNKFMAPVSTFLDKGYQVLNYNDNFLYYVLWFDSPYSDPDYEAVKKGWQSRLFASNQLIEEEQMAQVPGIAACIWANGAECRSEATVIADMFYILSAVMQKKLGIDLGPKEKLDRLFQKVLGQ